MKLSRDILAVIIFVIFAGFLIYFYVNRPQPVTVTTERLPVAQAGRSLNVPLFIDTKGEIINAAEIYLSYDPSVLKIESISKDRSFFSLWIEGQPTFSNEAGLVSFAGGLPTPGFTGKGQIGSITATVLKPGKAQLTFDQKSRILRNDGSGTAVPLQLDPIIIRAR